MIGNIIQAMEQHSVQNFTEVSPYLSILRNSPM